MSDGLTKVDAGRRGLPTYLIVAADDFGYFRSVSRGILECAERGVVTATALMANSPIFDTCAEWLLERPELDVGVHLALSYGEPLTQPLKRRFAENGGHFPTRFGAALQILRGRITLSEASDECRAQIERCLAAGLEVRFLNSHEHLHMLPALQGRIQALAAEYGISHTRLAGPEWRCGLTPQGLVRNVLLQLMGLRAVVSRPEAEHIKCIGTGVSGQLSNDYLGKMIPRLKAGRVYELMCHPGRFDAAEIDDQRLLQFHDWEGETSCLQGNVFQRLREEYGVQCVRYRDLPAIAGSTAAAATKEGVRA